MRGATVVVPPTSTAHVSRQDRRSTARDHPVVAVKEMGRRRWTKPSGDHGQARVENAFFRYTSIIGDGLRACSPAGPIRRWRTAWRTACQAAGVPTRFLHDCRRPAAAIKSRSLTGSHDAESSRSFDWCTAGPRRRPPGCRHGPVGRPHQRPRANGSGAWGTRSSIAAISRHPAWRRVVRGRSASATSARSPRSVVECTRPSSIRSSRGRCLWF